MQGAQYDGHQAAAAGNRWQVTIKSAAVTAEWEQLLKVAAKRQGTTFADFIVDTTRTAAQAVVKSEPVPTAEVPARLEDVGATLAEQIAALAEEQRDRLERIERASRRGRWRR